MEAPPTHALLRDGRPIPQTIDWDSFRSTVDLLAISVAKSRCDAVKKALSKLLLEMEHVKPIVNDPDPDRKRLMISRSVPVKAVESPELQPPVVQQILKDEATARLVVHSLHITVENITYDEVLRSLLPDDVEVPTSYETIGHIAHLNLRPAQLPYQHLIGQTILKKVAALRTVVNKTNNIESEFRTLPLQVIAGANELETSVRESGCLLKMNYAEVYWNSRLQAEHTRLVDSFAPSDRICIGPFAIPAAKRGCHVWANDLNPASHKYLVMNAALNKVTHRVHAYNLDARAFVREMANQDPPRLFHRYIVNLPAMSIEFLDVFRDLYPAGTFEKATLPLVHCYCFTSAEDPRTDVIKRASERIGHDLIGDPSVSVLEVRDVSPKKLFMCLTFRVPLAVLERPAVKRKSAEEGAPAAAGADSKKARPEEKGDATK